MEPNHPYFNLKREKKEALLTHRFRELRGCFSHKLETFKGACGAPWAINEGLELISFNNGIQSTKLNKGLEISTPSNFSFPRLGDRSDQYFVINFENKVHVYTADRNKCLKSYEFEEEVCQLTIQGSQLYVVERDLELVGYLTVINLEFLDQDSFSIVLPGEYLEPICFGKDHLIYIESFDEEDVAYALPLSVITNKVRESFSIRDVESDGFLYFFPEGNHFIEMQFCDDYFNVFRVYIEADFFRRETLAEKISIPNDSKSSIEDVHFSNNRLFFSYENPGNETKLFSYDIECASLVELISLPEHDGGQFFFPRFLSLAEKIYYISMKLESDEVTSHLTTLKFGKI
jgi:hypothetical protein